jgi:hypothetical protein
MALFASRLRAAARAAALGVAATGALVTVATAVATTPASAATMPMEVKYYVVGPPNNGHKDFLYDIAQRLLGSGDRWVEIFRLNQDRPQPGGGMLTDPQIIQPGWVLVLPADAAGPGVRVGPPPLPRPMRAAPTAGAAAAAGGSPVPVGMVTVVALCLGLVVGLPLLSAARHRPKPASRPGATG